MTSDFYENTLKLLNSRREPRDMCFDFMHCCSKKVTKECVYLLFLKIQPYYFPLFLLLKQIKSLSINSIIFKCLFYVNL